MNKNKNRTYQNLWEAAKAVLRWKFIALKICVNEERAQLNNLTLNLNQLEK